jgi:hypothetical protein
MSSMTAHFDSLRVDLALSPRNDRYSLSTHHHGFISVACQLRDTFHGIAAATNAVLKPKDGWSRAIRFEVSS